MVKGYFYTGKIAYGLQFSGTKNPGKIPSGSSPTGAPNRGGVSSAQQFSTNISLYLRNGAIYGHSYYIRLIGNRMRSIFNCSFIQ